MSDHTDNQVLAALARLETGQADIRTDVTGLRGEVARLEAGQADIRAEVTGLRVEVARLEAGQADIRAEVTGLRVELIGRMEAGQADIRAEVTGLRVELMARMDRLQDTISAVKDDIGVNMGATDAAQRVNDNTRQDLRSLHDQVSVMWRQLKAVQQEVRDIRG